MAGDRWETHDRSPLRARRSARPVSTFVLLPGAGGAAWYWHRVVPRLRAVGHDAVAVDLPGDDEQAGLPEYTQLAVEAVGAHAGDLVLVAQSLGGCTAPLVAGRLSLRCLVFVNAMIPTPGETPGAWWEDTGAVEARIATAAERGYGVEFDPGTYFLHDVPPEIVAAGEPHQRPEADAVFGSVCAFDAWPAIPIRVVAGADDRFFPVDFQRTVARDRLGVEADVLPGGHLMALARPTELADYLLDL
jgi:pimeloyl-ACP methyl ester carboxylesterase